MDVNKTVTMIFIILFFVYYDKVIKNTNKFFFKKKERDENYNNRIEELLNSFKVVTNIYHRIGIMKGIICGKNL